MKLKTEAELGKPQSVFDAKMTELIKLSPHKKLWQGTFYPPTQIKGISTEFGTIRTTKDKGRYIHQGVDILNDPLSVVWATHDGIVVIKDRFEGVVIQLLLITDLEFFLFFTILTALHL